jgi:ABC-type lipoprotein release transport system permease subunit
MMGALVFGLVNTLITAVMERIKELGMLRAIGMRRSAVAIQVVVESTIIMAAGVLVGVGLGFLLIYWVADGIDLSQWAAGVEMAGMRSLLVPRVNAADVLMISVLSLVMGILASLYPAWRAVKIKPLDAISR